jgi:hypothetical protein
MFEFNLERFEPSQNGEGGDHRLRRSVLEIRDPPKVKRNNVNGREK